MTLMSELQVPVDPDSADCEGEMEIDLQIWITALYNMNPYWSRPFSFSPSM